MRRTGLVVIGLTGLMVACGNGPSRPTESARLFLPAGHGARAVVVLVPGGGWRTADPTGLSPLARELARSGFVAATISYRAAAVGARFPVPPEDVLCGAASAVAQAGRAGRAGGPLVLVGHSAGGQLAMLVALRPGSFRSRCADPPVTPSGVVALAGAFDLTGVAEDLFGVSQRDRPDVWREGDVFAWVGERPDLPVLLVHGRADPLVPFAVSTRLAADLRAAGHRVRTELLPTATHDSIYRPAVVLPVLLDWLATTPLAVVPAGERRTP